jgi:hypothetical protein
MTRLIAALIFVLASSIAASAASCPLWPTARITAPCSIDADGDYVLGADLEVTSMPASFSGYETPIIMVGAGVTHVFLNCDGFRITHNGVPYTAKGIGVGGWQAANVHVLGCQFGGTGMMMCVMSWILIWKIMIMMICWDTVNVTTT